MNSCNKILTIAVVLLFSSTLTNIIVAAGGFRSIHQYDNKYVIVISASSEYEYGFKEGTIFHKEYKSFLRLSRILLWNAFNIKKKIAERHILYLKKYYPSFLERLKGISDATGINLIDILTMEVLNSHLFHRINENGCTLTGASSRITRDNKTYISWNVDLNYIYKILFSRYVKSPPFIICNISGKYSYAKISSLPSIFGFGLLNEKGIAFVTSSVKTNEKGEGLTSLELNNLAMESCATLDDVENLYRESSRESGLPSLNNAFGTTCNTNSMWADRNGNIMVIEYTHNRIAVKRGLLLAETNHYQFLDENNLDTLYIKDSKERLERAYNLLNQYNGSIDLYFYQNILTSDFKGGILKNFPDPMDICRFGPTFGTVASIIIIPDEYAAYYSPGHPCIVGFKYIDLSKYLEK